MSLAPLLAAALAGYLLGSIPFGLLLTRLAGFGDIRQIGSGNIGATNVLRTGSKPLAAATLLLDGGKGALAVFLGSYLGPHAAAIAGGAAMLGHLFPIWLGFKGGKGVATGLGVLLAAAFPIGIAACVAWLLIAFITRLSSLSALIGFAVAVVDGWVAGAREATLLALFLSALVYVRHIENIRRLLKGEEPRIGRKKA